MTNYIVYPGQKLAAAKSPPLAMNGAIALPSILLKSKSPVSMTGLFLSHQRPGLQQPRLGVSLLSPLAGVTGDAVLAFVFVDFGHTVLPFILVDFAG